MIHGIDDNFLVDILCHIVKQQGAWMFSTKRKLLQIPLAFFPTVIFPLLDRIQVFLVCLYFKGTVTATVLQKVGPTSYPVIYCRMQTVAVSLLSLLII